MQENLINFCGEQGDQMFGEKYQRTLDTLNIEKKFWPKIMKSYKSEIWAIFFSAKISSNLWAIFSRKNSPYALKFRPNGEISPNLVTLVERSLYHWHFPLADVNCCSKNFLKAATYNNTQVQRNNRKC
jgi:hypothetical protein